MRKDSFEDYCIQRLMRQHPPFSRMEVAVYSNKFEFIISVLDFEFDVLLNGCNGRHV